VKLATDGILPTWVETDLPSRRFTVVKSMPSIYSVDTVPKS